MGHIYIARGREAAVQEVSLPFWEYEVTLTTACTVNKNVAKYQPISKVLLPKDSFRAWMEFFIMVLDEQFRKGVIRIQGYWMDRVRFEIYCFPEPSTYSNETKDWVKLRGQ